MTPADYLLFGLLIIMIVSIMLTRTESFWGGYFPTPYLNQCVPRYGRYAVIASTDDPGMLVDENACEIN